MTLQRCPESSLEQFGQNPDASVFGVVGTARTSTFTVRDAMGSGEIILSF